MTREQIALQLLGVKLAAFRRLVKEAKSPTITRQQRNKRKKQHAKAPAPENKMRSGAPENKKL